MIAAGALAGCTADSGGGGAPATETDSPTESPSPTPTDSPTESPTPTDSPTGSPTPTDSPTPTETPSATPTEGSPPSTTPGATTAVSEATLERTGDCAGGDAGRVTVTADGTTVRVDGCIQGPTGCSQPELQSVSSDAGADRLVVTVGTVETAAVCTQQVVYRSYAVRVRLADGLPEVVTVRHAGDDGVRTVTETEL